MLRGMTPSQEISPLVALSPTVPQAADGMRIESARVGAERAEAHACGERGGGAAARSSSRPRQVVRIANGAESRFLARGAEGELVEVRLSDEDRAGLSEPRDGWRVRFRVCRGLCRAGCRFEAGDVDEILHRDGNAVQRPPVASGANFPLALFGVRQGLRVEPGDERVGLGPGVDLRETAAHERDGRERPPLAPAARRRLSGGDPVS